MSLLDDFDSVQGGAKPSQSLLADFDAVKVQKKEEAKKETSIAGHAYKAATALPRDLAEATGSVLSGIGTSIVGGWRGLAELARGGTLKDAAEAVHGEDEGAIARTYQPQSEGAQRIVGAVESPYNPMNWPGMLAKKAGEGAQDIGAPPSVAAGVETGLNALPLVLGVRGKPNVAVRNVGAPVVQETTGVRMPANVDVAPSLRPKPQAVPSAATPAVEVPKAPTFAADIPPAAEGKALPKAEQAARQAVLQRVGVPETVDSVIKGDVKARATDWQTSKLDTQSGHRMREIFDSERQALTNHAERIVRDTGGTLGTDSQALEARGHTIVQPLESFRQWFTDKTSGLYKEADARAKGQPVELGTFKGILGTDSKFANTDTIELRKGINARMRELGLIDKEGNLQPATVKQAEQLRQYINEEWSPKSNGRIRELKNSLDEDVTKAAGIDLYKQARALHSMKESIFSDPKGLSSILDSEGINRKVPIERIADSISALPNAQFEHIVKTLRTVPPELKPQAQAAIAEIKAHLANRLLETGNKTAGQWNAKGTSAFLNKNSAKLSMVFDKAELARIKDLNDAGHILKTEQSYPGAAVQEHNLVKRGAMAGIRAGSAAVGGALGAIVGAPGTGAAMGDFIGGGAAAKFSEAQALKNAQKRVVKLSDFPK